MTRPTISSLQAELETQKILGTSRLEEAQRATTVLRQELEAAKLSQKEVVEVLQKELASAKSTKDLYYNQLNAAQQEMEAVHQVMDAIPGAPAREGDEDRYGGKIRRNTITRLAGFFAAGNFRGAA
jgi:seryl-tRNA synthetase